MTGTWRSLAGAGTTARPCCRLGSLARDPDASPAGPPGQGWRPQRGRDSPSGPAAEQHGGAGGDTSHTGAGSPGAGPVLPQPAKSCRSEGSNTSPPSWAAGPAQGLLQPRLCPVTVDKSCYRQRVRDRT
ncbi:translation initiation factor IF-2-like isoform X3 [Fukomys damarensis]|uniref:translation initiation factor IF-2-like isoform X3 n=1 Tax=Fukomys damarensis TaxID=885580 RepID=UPI00053F36F9|nr:translation initiation factor IF-2-like isoform X3 [Fukomys damarensis]